MIYLPSRRYGFDPWIGKVPWRRKWQPTPVFFPGEFHGQRSLTGYRPWGHKESDTIERLSTAQYIKWASLVAQMVKNLPAIWETWVPSLGWEDPLEKGMPAYSSILAWRIPMDRGAWQLHGVPKSQT